METKCSFNRASEGSRYKNVIVDFFSNYTVTVPTPKNFAQNTVNSIVHHWITNFGSPQYLVTDKATDYLNTEFANCCTFFNIRHSPRISNGPWTNGIAEV